MKRIIKFDTSAIKQDQWLSKGIYKIINLLKPNSFYIGSTNRNFRERFKEHCGEYAIFLQNGGKMIHPILWKAYSKYGIENFKVEILEILNNCSEKQILKKESEYIKRLNPRYNIAKDPEVGGNPNKGKKLSKEWKDNIAKKSKMYKHDKETLKKVTENNKKNACILQFIKNNEILEFKSWLEAEKHFGVDLSYAKTCVTKNKKYKGYTIKVKKTQKKKIKVFFEDKTEIFESFNACDRALDMWRGYTSTMVIRKNLVLKDKYKYEII